MLRSTWLVLALCACGSQESAPPVPAEMRSDPELEPSAPAAPEPEPQEECTVRAPVELATLPAQGTFWTAARGRAGSPSRSAATRRT